MGESLGLLLQILGTYGAWGLLLAVFLYLLLKGQLTFQYPRSKEPKKKPDS